MDEDDHPIDPDKWQNDCWHVIDSYFYEKVRRSWSCRRNLGCMATPRTSAGEPVLDSSTSFEPATRYRLGFCFGDMVAQSCVMRQRCFFG